MITVRNLTDKFVSIMSISIYYGADDAMPISTFNWEKLTQSTRNCLHEQSRKYL
jgi:hypothetical protein